MIVEDVGEDVSIPGPSARAAGSGPEIPPDLAYLPGHTLGELLRAEYEATAAALAQMGRMSCTLRLPDLSAATLGEAIMFFQLATGYAGVWYGIDPFDQPGVELGKRLTYAALGRPGHDAQQVPVPAGIDEA
jgi:glucose-6-phosphate isomerase